MVVANAHVDPVDLSIDEYFLEYLNAFHRLQLLLLLQQLLHQLLALVCVPHLGYLLDLLVEPDVVDDLIVDVLKD